MKQKRTYLPANIRAGFTINDARLALANTYHEYGAPFKVCVCTFGHGRDVNGNGTAHYECHIVATHKTSGKEICFLRAVQSGKRREQVGYGAGNGAALYALEKLGYKLDLSKAGSYDSHGEACYPVLNFEELRK